MSELTLGEKIKNFRKRAGLSQFQLEQEIDAAPGSISRIESGKVNPTKETLLAISHIFKLHQEESSSLFGIGQTDPDPKQVAAIIDSMSDYFADSQNYAFLLDPRERILMISDGLVSLLKLDREQIAPFLGNINLLEVIFDESLGFSSLIANREAFAPYELALFRTELSSRLQEDWAVELLKKLQKYEFFNKCWELSESIPRYFYPNKGREVEIDNGEERISIVSHFKKLNSDPRFELVDYYVLDK